MHMYTSLRMFSDCVLYLYIMLVGHLMFVFTDHGQNNYGMKDHGNKGIVLRQKMVYAHI